MPSWMSTFLSPGNYNYAFIFCCPLSSLQEKAIAKGQEQGVGKGKIYPSWAHELEPLMDLRLKMMGCDVSLQESVTVLAVRNPPPTHQVQWTLAGGKVQVTSSLDEVTWPHLELTTSKQTSKVQPSNLFIVKSNFFSFKNCTRKSYNNKIRNCEDPPWVLHVVLTIGSWQRPPAFQPVPEQMTSSTITLAPHTSSPSFQILQRSFLSIPSNRVTRALCDIYLTLDIHNVTA